VSDLPIEGTTTSMWGAWAITYGFAERPKHCHPFVGRWYFERFGTHAMERATKDGISVALFRTKTAARDALRIVKRKNPKAKIVRVAVSLRYATVDAEAT